MSIKNPEKKMSKTNDDPIYISDSPADIAAKLKKAVTTDKGATNLLDLLRHFGEPAQIAKFERIDALFVASYIHGAYRIGVLVGLDKEAAEAGKDIAMQIAALNPVAVDAASVPAEVIAREKDSIVELMKQDPKMAGKPEEMIAKIAEGKMGAFFK